MTAFDYVIVGSGYGGSVLAKRLTEEPGVTACILEAGGRDRHPYIKIRRGGPPSSFPAHPTCCLPGSSRIWASRPCM